MATNALAGILCCTHCTATVCTPNSGFANVSGMEKAIEAGAAKEMISISPDAFSLHRVIRWAATGPSASE